jgi:hypothetical protein
MLTFAAVVKKLLDEAMEDSKAIGVQGSKRVPTLISVHNLNLDKLMSMAFALPILQRGDTSLLQKLFGSCPAVSASLSYISKGESGAAWRHLCDTYMEYHVVGSPLRSEPDRTSALAFEGLIAALAESDQKDATPLPRVQPLQVKIRQLSRQSGLPEFSVTTAHMTSARCDDELFVPSCRNGPLTGFGAWHLIIICIGYVQVLHGPLWRLGLSCV